MENQCDESFMNGHQPCFQEHSAFDIYFGNNEIDNHFNSKSKKNIRLRNIMVNRNRHLSNRYNIDSELQREIFPLKDMPSCTSFNELLVLDIESYNGNLLLSLIDAFTNYSVTIALNEKSLEDIIHNISEYWVEIFGPPYKIVTSDFNCKYVLCKELKLILESKGIQFSFISHQHAWCVEICNQNHNMVIEYVNEILSFGEFALPVALSWAVNHKNCTENALGFSPSLLVFGINLLLPTVKLLRPPSLSKIGYANMIIRHSEAQKYTRNSFVRAQLSKISRRSLNQTCPNFMNYIAGDKVLFRTCDKLIWQGPAVFIAQEDRFVLISYQNSLIKVLLHDTKLVECMDTLAVPQNYDMLKEKVPCSVPKGECKLNQNNVPGVFENRKQIVFDISELAENKPKDKIAKTDAYQIKVNIQVYRHTPKFTLKSNFEDSVLTIILVMICFLQGRPYILFNKVLQPSKSFILFSETET